MANNAPANSLSIFSLLEALRRRKLLIIIPALLLCAGFSIYAYKQPNRYRAQAVLAAEQLTPPEYLKHLAPQPLNIQEHLWTVREVLFSRPLLEAAARQLRQYRDVQGPLPQEILDTVKAEIDIKVEGEHTFQVLGKANDAADAMNLTNKLAAMFVEKASANRKQRNEETRAVIDEQLDALKQRLEGQSQKLHSYKSQAIHALPDHIDDNIRAVDMLKGEYQAKETKIAEEDARRTAVIREMRELEAKGVLDQPMIQEKTPGELRLDDLRIKEKELSTRYTPQFPEVIQIQREIRNLERSIATQPKKVRSDPSPTYLRYVALKSELEAIDQRMDAYRREQQSMSAQISSYSRRIEATPQNERVIEDMKREYEVGELQFHALLDKQLDAKLAKGLQQSESGIEFAIIEPASLPAGPYSPQRERLVLLGLFAGLGLGLVMAFFKEQNDTTFSNVDDFQVFTTLPVVGVIPNVGGKKGCRHAIVTLTEPDSVAAEQYRILAMKVQQQCEANKAKVLLITSAAGGEGKSLTAINLATALSATANGQVLLIDADMRKPRINEYLNIQVTPEKGFHALLGKPDDDAAKYVTKIKNLHVIPGNATDGNPVAVLASAKARELFDRLKESFEFIIIDAPPTLPIADSHVLSGLSDRVLFVVRARETPRELFQHAVESFDATNLLGAVLNDVDYQRSRYAYAYEYYKKPA